MTTPKHDLEQALAILDDHKARDPISFDVQERSALFDYLIVTSGTSSRHVQSLAKAVQAHFKPMRAEKPRMEGYETGEWVLVDLGSLLVHVMQPEARAFYNLEALWQPYDA